jgi:hypothetical protein
MTIGNTTVVVKVKATETATNRKAEAAITTIVAEAATRVSHQAALNLFKEEEETAEEEVVTEAGTIREAAVSPKVPLSQIHDQDKRVNLSRTTSSWLSKTKDLSIFTKLTGALWATSAYINVKP